MRRSRLAAVVLTASLALAPAAHAFVPDGDGLIVASGAPPRLVRRVEAARIDGWDARRDRDTGAVTAMWGRHVDVPGAVRDPVVAERAARAFLAAHVLPAGTRSEDFVVAANRVDGGKRTVAFVQTWRGLRVVGGQMHVVFARDRLFYAASAALPIATGIPLAADVARPRARADRAAAWVGASLRATGERVVLPIVRGPGDLTYRVADVFDAPARHADVYVALDGTPLAHRSRAHHATSTLLFDIGLRHAAGPRTQVPAPELAITVDGTPATTGLDGGFTWGTDVAATVAPSLAGARVTIVNEAGPVATTSLTAQPGQPVAWSAAADEAVDAQVSAYAYAAIAKAIGRRIDPTLAWLDQPIAVHVNIDQTCNAFSTGDAIHFFRASAECQNTARVADIVHHEFGHSFHAQSIIPGAGGSDSSIVEGVADFFAANISGDSGIGRGLAYDDTPVRELDPIGSERVYPRDLTPISHWTGLIIGGALWDLRAQLAAQLAAAEATAVTDRIFLGILQRASDVTTAYQAALVADDDDGDLGNGTPHGCTIESAFGRHGLAGSEFRETALRPAEVTGRRVAVTVDTPAGTACPPAAVTAMTLAWRVGDGPASDVAMTAAGATWSAELPDLPAGTVVRFRIAAALDTSETLLLPDNPADPEYQAFLGTPTELWCERFDVDPRWKQSGDGEWEVDVADPANTAAGDPAAAFAGARWLGNDLGPDGRYRADILTSIETPPIDASAWGSVHLQFRRWLVIEDSALDVATIRVNKRQIWANASNDTNSLDHVDREWRFVDFDVTPFASQPMTFAWTLASDPLRQLGGWNLDEICVVGLDKRAVCGDGVVDRGEECDEVSDGCEPTLCVRVENDGGCCSSSKDSWLSSLLLLALVQFVMMFARRR